jgi:hypothetical protein
MTTVGGTTRPEGEVDSQTRWLEGHQIGLLSYSLLQAEPGGRMIGALRSAIADKTSKEAIPVGEVPRLASLPVQSLRFLREATADARVAGRLRELHEEVNDALQWLGAAGEAPYGYTRLARVGTWCAHLLHGSAPPERLLRLGVGLIGYRQRSLDVSEVEPGELDDPVSILRDPYTTTAQRCEAVAAVIATLERDLSARWAIRLLESYLYRHQFAWPLIVLGETDQSGKGYAFGFPVGVDIEFFDRHQQSPTVVLGEEGPVSIQRWRGRLRNSARIGRELWRAKHGHFGQFRHVVYDEQQEDGGARTVVTFDFTLAQELAAPHKACTVKARGGEASDTPDFELSDGSADAYLAQVVLSRLLGRTPAQVNIATGVIGERHKDDEGREYLNYAFRKPAGVEAKLEYVFASGHYERIVLPTGSEGEVARWLESADARWAEDEGDGRQTAEVVYARDLHVMADAMHPHGWRQYKYIRCPDLAWAAHGRDHRGRIRTGLLSRSNAGVKRVVKAIQSEDGKSVRRLDALPLEVVSALWHLQEQRTDLDPHIPPTLSWAFFRVRDCEQSLRFWELVLDACGAPEEDLRALIEKPRFDLVVSEIADVLDRLDPNDYRPSHRAPDVLVVVGLERIEEEEELNGLPESDPYRVAEVLAALGEKGLVSVPRRKQPLLGSTRVILVPDSPSAAPVQKNDLNDRIEQWRKVIGEQAGRYVGSGAAFLMLSRLALIRGGFTQRVAAYALRDFRYVRNQMREHVLHPALQLGLLRYFAGEYFIPDDVKQALEKRKSTRSSHDSRKRDAQTHHEIGKALAPYVIPNVPPTLAADVALRAENIHEAEFHLDRARELLNRKEEHEEREEIHSALNNLFLYTSLERWGTVVRLLRSRSYQDAYKLARTLISRAEEAKAAHSSHYQLAGRAASDTAFASDNALLRNAARMDAERWFEKALALAPESSLPAYAEALALTNYASFLTGTNKKPIRPLLERARECVLDNESDEPWRGLNGKPFVWAGDREEAHGEALAYYMAGVEVAPDWFDLWPMALAAAELSGDQAAVRHLYRSLINTLERRTPKGLTAGGLLRQRLNSAEYRWSRDKRRKPHIERRRTIGLQMLGNFLDTTERQRTSRRSHPVRGT